MEQRTQNDIVNQHLQSLQIGEVLEDKLKIPRLEILFSIEKPRSPSARRTEKIRLPLVLKASTSTRDEIAGALLQCLQYRNDIVGMKWSVGEEYVEVSREPGAITNLGDGVTDDDIQSVFLNILKSRALLRRFEWDFSLPYVKVAFENSQFA